MLTVLCGMVPSSLLVWAGPNSAVTGETGGGVASPQKSSELNKPPGEHSDFISFTVRLWQLQKKFFFQHPKRGGSRFTKLLWQCANLPFQLLYRAVFISSSPSLSSHSLTSFLVAVRPVQTSSHSALLVIYQPNGTVVCLSFCLSMSLFSFIVAVQPFASGSCCNVHLLLRESDGFFGWC